MTEIIISGIDGRMGSLIAEIAKKDPEIELIGGVEKEGHPEFPSQLEPIIDKTDVLVEFTTPEATLEHLKIAQKHKKSIVIGTTGFTPEQYKEIDKLIEGIACLISPNMSPGVNLMFNLVSEISKRLGNGYDIEIIESHHRYKKDAPSGTAKRLVENICKATGHNQIPTHSIRAGEIVGEHTAIWAGPGEVIELTHCALSRTTFANGAIQAAKFVARAKPGKYSMHDVLSKIDDR